MSDVSGEHIPSKRLVVEIPQEADPYGHLALTSLLHVLGYPYHETKFDMEVISPADILKASEQYFGSKHYGVLANDIIAYTCNAASGDLVGYGMSSPLKSQYFADFPSSLLNLQRVRVDVRDAIGRNPNGIRKILASRQNPVALPFELVGIESSSGNDFFSYNGSYRTGILRPGPTRKQYLKEFLVGFGWDKHEHQGVVGRAIDLLCNKAGLKELDPDTPFLLDSDFIELDKLCKDAKSSGLSKDIVRHMRERVIDSFYHGIMPRDHWTPKELLTFEGQTRLYPGRGKSVNVEKIAWSSLPLLARQYTSSQAADFLIQYAETRYSD